MSTRSPGLPPVDVHVTLLVPRQNSPPFGAVTVNVVKALAESGAKKPPATSAMATTKTGAPLRTRKKLSFTREREREFYS